MFPFPSVSARAFSSARGNSEFPPETIFLPSARFGHSAGRSPWLTPKAGRACLAVDFAGLRVVTGKLPYLNIFASWRASPTLSNQMAVLQPGQAAGTRSSWLALRGDGAIDRLAFPDLCGAYLPVAQAIEAVQKLLEDDEYYAHTLENARELALKSMSFSKVKERLLAEFSR
jgi:hypothetical protein